MNKEYIQNQKGLGIIILIIICIISLYKYYTRPVNIHNLIYNESVASIDVYIVTNGSDNRIEIDLINKEDINQLINILDQYEYSKIPKMYIDGVYPASINDLIDMRIIFSSNRVSHQQLSVDKRNEVSISFGNGKYRDYKIKGNNGLYEELLEWFGTNYLNM